MTRIAAPGVGPPLRAVGASLACADQGLELRVVDSFDYPATGVRGVFLPAHPLTLTRSSAPTQAGGGEIMEAAHGLSGSPQPPMTWDEMVRSYPFRQEAGAPYADKGQTIFHWLGDLCKIASDHDSSDGAEPCPG